MNIFGFSHQLCTHNFSQSYQRSSDFDTPWKDYYVMKENSCKIIWWRPRIKIHNPTTPVWYKFNSCMPTQSKVSTSYFIVWSMNFTNLNLSIHPLSINLPIDTHCIFTSADWSEPESHEKQPLRSFCVLSTNTVAKTALNMVSNEVHTLRKFCCSHEHG